MTEDGPISTTTEPGSVIGPPRQSHPAVLQEGAKTLSEQAYEQLRAEIQAGVLLPGAKLSTNALKKRLGVSLSTVREALTRLMGDSVVTLQGQRGFRVAPVSPRDLHDLISMRKMVEGEGLARSIQLGDDAWEGTVVGAFHELRRIEARLKQAITSEDGASISRVSGIWEEKNARFHVSMISACQSPRLLKLYGELYDQTARYRQITFVGQGHTLRSVDEEHEAIFEAVMSRDASQAREATSRHLDSILDYFEPYIKSRE